jgi:hypothetical protein
MSNFSYKDGTGKIIQIPVMYGDPSRQAASVLKKNSENTVPSAPFIACYIKGLKYEQTRLQDPTFVSKVQIREREYNEDTQQYTYAQGQGYTVERIMPAPYKLTFSADIWTTNSDQKLQIIEQLAYLFNPSLELQTTDNYLDWTSLTVLQLDDINWTNRQIPQGAEQNIDIGNLTFSTPIWITPPAKVKRLGIITKIIASAFVNPTDSIDLGYDQPLFKTVVTPGNFELMVLDNVASLLKNHSASGIDDTTIPSGTASWFSLLDLYPGQFRAGLTKIFLTTSDGNEIIAYISLDPNDDTKMLLNFDRDTVPSNTIITSSYNVNGRGTVDAIINPETYSPSNVAAGTRYLILEGINDTAEFGQEGFVGPVAWQNSDNSDFQANANDIIEWNGTEWHVIFNSTISNDIIYITNSYTGIQYKWESGSWSKSFEGIYIPELWRLVL